MGTHLGLIVKATRLCNLRCSYCHDWGTGPGSRMSAEVLARTVETSLASDDIRAVDFMWHGGEPTVLPMSFYENALELQGKHRRPGQVIKNKLQTNGTLLTDAWVHFLGRHDFRLGVSLDGPPANHDKYRRYASGRPSYSDVVAGIGLLRDAKIPFGVEMVIDDYAIELGGEAIFAFILESGIKAFIPIAVKPANQPSAKPVTPTSPYVEPHRMADFLLALFAAWKRHGDQSINIWYLSNLERKLRGIPDGFCVLAGHCIGRYFMVETNGDVAHCDLFIGDRDYVVGNVMETGLSELRASPRVEQLALANDADVNALRGCPNFNICNGWCPHERYLSTRHDAMHTPDCCGLSPLINQMRDAINLEDSVALA